MSDSESDSISSLHKRWFFTNINPSSKKFSYLIAVASLLTNIIFINFIIKHYDILEFAKTSPIIVGIFTATLVFDYLSLNGTPLNRFSKVLHVAAFANLLWTLTVTFSYISEFIIYTNHSSINSIMQGMFMAIGLRIGIFTSVFGASLKRAIPISFIQPLIIFIIISFFYFNHIFFTNFSVYLFGAIILTIGILWAIIIDRIGRPNFASAFKILQAFLKAWTENKSEEMERIAEEKANSKFVKTFFVKLKSQKNVTIVLPELHPGPFNPIGGSNLPYDIFKFYSGSAMVMHSISDHSLNIPSQKEVKKYLDSLSNTKHLESGDKCTVPISQSINDCNCTGFALGKNVMIFLSKSPSGMEDIPPDVKVSLEKYSKELGFDQILIIDSHNSMGNKIEKQDIDNFINVGKKCLEKIIGSEQFPFKIGYSNSFQIEDKLKNEKIKYPDLGDSQFGVLTITIENKDYVLCWCDSNNMKKGIREKIIAMLKTEGYSIIEICTSDTHSTSGKRNTKGYYTLGDIMNETKIIDIFQKLVRLSKESTCFSTFEIQKSETHIKVMGNDQFDDYSYALEKSFKVTKIFLATTFVVYIIMLLIT
jgi:putative membrane protein